MENYIHELNGIENDIGFMVIVICSLNNNEALSKLTIACSVAALPHNF